MSTASDILSGIWTKGSTHEYNYCNSLSSSLSTGIVIDLENNGIAIVNPHESVSLSVQGQSQLSALETNYNGIHFGEANISYDKLNNSYFPWGDRNCEVLSESDVDRYRGIIDTVLSAFNIFVDGYPDKEIDHSVWTDTIQEILGEPI